MKRRYNKKCNEAFNPQSCEVVSFKKPNDTEISHDYLWRIHKFAPA